MRAFHSLPRTSNGEARYRLLHCAELPALGLTALQINCRASGDGDEVPFREPMLEAHHVQGGEDSTVLQSGACRRAFSAVMDLDGRGDLEIAQDVGGGADARAKGCVLQDPR